MPDPALSTLEGLLALRAAYAERIPGWTAPVLWGVAVDEAFGHINLPGGMHGLAAAALALGIGHDGSTATVPLTGDQLMAAIDLLAPAEACTSVEHPNLAVWRRAVESGAPLVAVFIAAPSDPVTSDLDRVIRGAAGVEIPEDGA
jgi:hypothetical protein